VVHVGTATIRRRRLGCGHWRNRGGEDQTRDSDRCQSPHHPAPQRYERTARERLGGWSGSQHCCGMLASKAPSPRRIRGDPHLCKPLTPPPIRNKGPDSIARGESHQHEQERRQGSSAPCALRIFRPQVRAIAQWWSKTYGCFVNRHLSLRFPPSSAISSARLRRRPGSRWRR
jgi:hypothetical protein